MRHNWTVSINREGDLDIRAEENMGAFENLFGMKSLESGLRIYAHELKSVRQMLLRLFPNAAIRNIEALEQIIKEEFCENRSVNDFRHFLESAHIPFRTYSHVA